MGIIPTLKLGGGFKYFLFSPLPGEMIPFDQFFSDGLKPPTRKKEKQEIHPLKLTYC